MRIRPALPLVIAVAMVASGCGGSSGGSGDPPEPAFQADRFAADSATVDNPYFPLIPGTTYVLEGDTEEGRERNEVSVSHDTREILGVLCAVVVDRVYLDGELVEETFDWYAQDMDGNVWYMGEDSREYEGGEVVSTAGSWEAGRDVAGLGTAAQPGIIMKGAPRVGDSYRQEYYEGEAEDMALVVAADETVTLADGTIYEHCLETREWSPLEPDVVEHKYYAPGVGVVLEALEDGSERMELVSVPSP